MKNYKLARINNTRFSIRFVHIAENYGCKTVGAFEKVMQPLQPNTKLYYRTAGVRKARLVKEIDNFRRSY